MKRICPNCGNHVDPANSYFCDRCRSELPKRLQSPKRGSAVVAIVKWLWLVGLSGVLVAIFDGGGLGLIVLGLGVMVVGLAIRFTVYVEEPPVQSRTDRDLQQATSDWRLPVVMRSYPHTKAGTERREREANVLAGHGYAMAAQSAAGGHVNVARTAAPAVLTGGLSLLFGASRAKATIDVTYQKAG